MLQTIKSFFQNMWTKVVDWAMLAWNESWTKAAAWVVGLPSALLSVADVINMYITDPMFKTYLDIIHVPQEVTIALASFSIIVWFAHGRKNDVAA